MSCRLRATLPAVFGPVGELGGEAPEGVERPAVRLHRPGGQAELVPDLADAGGGPRRLGPGLRVVGLLAGELLVEGQRLLEELPLERRQPALVRQPLLGDLGVHLVDRPAGVGALAVGLGEARRAAWPSAAAVRRSRIDGPDRHRDAHGQADQQRHRHQRRGRQRRPVPAGELARTDTTPTAGTPPPARRSGSASRRRRSRWPSRSGGRGPSPAPSSRSSPARRAPTGPAAAGRPCGWPRRSSASRPACSAACSACGGSSSRMIRRISSKAGLAERLLVERRRAGQQLVEQHAQASRCRCGCRRPARSARPARGSCTAACR